MELVQSLLLLHWAPGPPQMFAPFFLLPLHLTLFVTQPDVPWPSFVHRPPTVPGAGVQLYGVVPVLQLYWPSAVPAPGTTGPGQHTVFAVTGLPGQRFASGQVEMPA